MSLAAELAAVVEELSSVERDLNTLLHKQSQLLNRRRILEEKLNTESNETANTDWSNTNFKWSPRLGEVLRDTFRVYQLRPLQLEAMNCILNGNDCILIMPTGAGKSLCFQAPALVRAGLTLVICPLVSLMEDQVYALKNRGVQCAELINASSSKEHVNRVQNAMIEKNHNMHLLYVSPEKLAKSKRFMNRLEKSYEKGILECIVIDEVHCCSQWGHDFRPDYKFLGILKKQFPKVPILGLTATATGGVLNDVQKMLHLQGALTLRSSFNRPNLFYEVRPKPMSNESCMDDLSSLIKDRFHGQSGIVYCLTQKDSDTVAYELQLRDVKAAPYHANLDAEVRSNTHHDWLRHEVHVVVATIAFGMGIDKPDVRFVIHHSLSKSLQNYYQESGRAGRDGCMAYCILYAGVPDVFRQSTMVFTEQTGLEKLYHMTDYMMNNDLCRRTVLARHFAEKTAECSSMCDVCTGELSGPVDVLPAAKRLLAVVQYNASKKQRVTFIKVMDACYNQGPSSLRPPSGSAPILPRSKAQWLLLYLLIHGYIKEDFHFTPYSTISYLLPGAKALLQTGSLNLCYGQDSNGDQSNDDEESKKGHARYGQGNERSKRKRQDGNKSKLSKKKNKVLGKSVEEIEQESDEDFKCIALD